MASTTISKPAKRTSRAKANGSKSNGSKAKGSTKAKSKRPTYSDEVKAITERRAGWRAHRRDRGRSPSRSTRSCRRWATRARNWPAWD